MTNWSRRDIEAAITELSEHEDAWDLAAWGGRRSPDGIDRGTAWIHPGSTPHPDLIAWRAQLIDPDMITIEEYGVPRPGEGQDRLTN